MASLPNRPPGPASRGDDAPAAADFVADVIAFAEPRMASLHPLFKAAATSVALRAHAVRLWQAFVYVLKVRRVGVVYSAVCLRHREVRWTATRRAAARRRGRRR